MKYADMIIQLAKLQIYPVTLDRWKDFEKLFGQNGACAGCWSRSVWSMMCFYGARGSCRSGVTGSLLEAAVQFARKHCAQIIEGYPVDSGGEKKNTTSVSTGSASTFKRAGFVEVARCTPTCPIMRYCAK